MDADPVRRYLHQLVEEHDTNLAEVSRLIGRNHAYLQQFMKRGTPRTLPEDVRELLGRHFSVAPENFRPLRRGVRPPVPTSASDTPLPRAVPALSPRSAVTQTARDDVVEIDGAEFAMISVYDIRASAGPGAINQDGEPLYRQAFMMSWLRDVSMARPRDLAVIRVSGDSMQDTLHNGDHVLIDRSIRQIGRDGIYVLRLHGDELMVKRCMRSVRTKLLTIKSDNPVYPSETDVQDDDIEVVGRVIWLGRSIGG